MRTLRFYIPKKMNLRIVCETYPGSKLNVFHATSLEAHIAVAPEEGSQPCRWSGTGRRCWIRLRLVDTQNILKQTYCIVYIL